MTINVQKQKKKNTNSLICAAQTTAASGDVLEATVCGGCAAPTNCASAALLCWTSEPEPKLKKEGEASLAPRQECTE